MSDTPGAVEQLAIEANLRKERRDWAKRHDAEDARRQRDFDADMLRRNLERDKLRAVLRQAREALQEYDEWFGDLNELEDDGVALVTRGNAARAAIDALEVRG